jgi:uncharacterized membrane protein YgcG
MPSHRSAGNNPRVWYPALLIAALFFCAPGRGIAQNYSASEEEFVVRPHPCWTMTMEFYDPQAFPYYSVNGYFFDANPFQGYRYVNSPDKILMRSSKAAPGGTSYTGLYPLRDVSGSKVWTDARILVQCYVKESFFGLISTQYAVVAQEFGSVEDARTACEGGDPTRLVIDYDPYNPYPEGGDGSCGSPGSGGEPGGGGGGSSGACHDEWLIVERSDDGGATWYVVWEGWGTVCE